MALRSCCRLLSRFVSLAYPGTQFALRRQHVWRRSHREDSPSPEKKEETPHAPGQKGGTAPLCRLCVDSVPTRCSQFGDATFLSGTGEVSQEPRAVEIDNILCFDNFDNWKTFEKMCFQSHADPGPTSPKSQHSMPALHNLHNCIITYHHGMTIG